MSGIPFVISLKKIKRCDTQFLITMAVTVVFDLTVPFWRAWNFYIIVHYKVSDMQISVSDVESDRLKSTDWISGV